MARKNQKVQKTDDVCSSAYVLENIENSKMCVTDYKVTLAKAI